MYDRKELKNIINKLSPRLKFSSQFSILILNDEIFYSHEHKM